MAISAAQCRAARALIAWSQDDLARESKVAKATVATFEAGKRSPYGRTLEDVQAALEAAGVEFIPENGGGAGVRLMKAKQGKGPKPTGPASDVVEKMDAAIDEHRKGRRSKD